jgi:4-hydroxy-4-methyl-2-oxoglutarate aldolase
MRVRITPAREDLIELTSAWKGDRFSDGRPCVPDDVLERLRQATTEEAWSVLLEEEFERQFSGGWRETHPGTILVGRAVTAQFLPHRPDFDAVVVEAGAREGRVEGDRQNSWIIETLRPGDVMVADIFGKVKEGTVVGDNLGTAVASRTGVGAVIDGGIRDYQGLMQLKNVNLFFRDVDPTPIRDVTLAGINLPIRIDQATVLPGDIVLGTPTGLIFIPSHLAEKVADMSEDIRTRDIWAKRVLAERRYTSAEIDVPTWASHIEEDFQLWRASL